MKFEPGTVTVEYYENGALTPTRTKQLNVIKSNLYPYG